MKTTITLEDLGESFKPATPQELADYRMFLEDEMRMRKIAFESDIQGDALVLEIVGDVSGDEWQGIMCEAYEDFCHTWNKGYIPSSPFPVNA